MKELYDVIEDVLTQNEVVKIQVTGNSMYPFLRDRVDSVELCKAKREKVRPLDIVMIRRHSGEYIVHRVVKINQKNFYIIGDAEQEIEGPLEFGQLVAVVSSIYRKEYKIHCDSLKWRLLSCIWLYTRPFRYGIFRIYGRIRRVV